ncbi:MAG: polysaccharide deacetylase family protein [Polyangiales bacterium]
MRWGAGVGRIPWRGPWLAWLGCTLAAGGVAHSSNLGRPVHAVLLEAHTRHSPGAQVQRPPQGGGEQSQQASMAAPSHHPAPLRHTSASTTRPDLGSAHREGLVVHGGTPRRLILFTFDDGPDLRYTPKLLHSLRARQVQAMFFLTGRRLLGPQRRSQARRRLAAEIAAEGHVIASHTLDHLQLPLLKRTEVIQQLRGAERAFKLVFGARPWLVRPPGGARSARVDGIISARGYTQVMWNLGTGDTQSRSAEEVFRTWQKVMSRREREHGERGGILLMHDTHPWSVEAFERIHAELERRNCILATRGEELYDIVGDLSFFYAPRSIEGASAAAPVAEPDPEVFALRQRRLRQETRARCTAGALARHAKP